MAFIDFIILLLAIWAVYRGWRAGFLKEIISMIGFFVGLFLAAALYSNFGEYLAPKIGASPGVSDVIAFILIWVVVPILLGMVANILTKTLKGMKLGLPNSILGAALSTMKYLVLMSCIFNVMSAIGITGPEKTKDSVLYNPVKDALGKMFEYINDNRNNNADSSPDNDDTALFTPQAG